MRPGAFAALWMLLATWAMPALGQAAQPVLQTFTLPNGLRVIHREDHERPVLRAKLRLLLRPEEAASGHEGISALTLRMMDHGEAAQMSSAAFDRALDEGGIQLTRTLEAEAVTWTLSARGREQDRAMGLLADRILRPTFNQAELAAQRLACWRELQADFGSPRIRLRQGLGLDRRLLPTEKALGQLTCEDLASFHRGAFRPERAILALQGDLGLEQAKAMVLLSFGSWTAASGPPASAPAMTALPPDPAPVRIPAPGQPLRVEMAALPPAELGPASRALLALLLCGDRAWVPAALELDSANGSPLSAHLIPPGSLSAAQALEALRGRLETLRQRGFTDADLRGAKLAWFAGRQVRTLHPDELLADSLQEVAGEAATPAAIEAQTLEALNRVLRQWLEPANLRWGLLGDPVAIGDSPAP